MLPLVDPDVAAGHVLLPVALLRRAALEVLLDLGVVDVLECLDALEATLIRFWMLVDHAGMVPTEAGFHSS